MPSRKPARSKPVTAESQRNKDIRKDVARYVRALIRLYEATDPVHGPASEENKLEKARRAIELWWYLYGELLLWAQSQIVGYEYGRSNPEFIKKLSKTFEREITVDSHILEYIGLGFSWNRPNYGDPMMEKMDKAMEKYNVGMDTASIRLLIRELLVSRRVAKAHLDERVPTLEQIRHVIRTMPAGTEIERRDRTLIAFTILTGARDGATASLKLKHIDIDQGRVDQDARQVNTKFSKSFATWFFPVGEDIHRVVVDWVNYLRQEKLWGLDDPLFPATKIVLGAGRHFEASGLDRKHWSGAGPIRKIFKHAFAAGGLPYFNPHSFRKTLALLGGQVCKSPEEYKAWSQNLGHENVLTTFSSYGDVGRHRQAEIIRSLGTLEPRIGS
jgi:integrase